MTGLGTLPGGWISKASDISADGAIIVGSSDSSTDTQAVIWDAEGIHSLKDLLTQRFHINLDGWRLEEATAISDNGREIVGNGVNPSGDREAWLVHLPPIVKADFDKDGDVDAADTAFLESCRTGPMVPLANPTVCGTADLDGDNDVDQVDFAHLQRCYSGSGIEPTPGCE